MRIQSRRNGFSLMELMLSLGLTIIVLGMITTAIYINLEQLEKRQIDVERAQLGRAIMRRIADDLRASVRYQTLDLSGLDSAVAGADPGQLGDLAAESGVEGVDIEEDLPADALDLAAAAEPSSVVGIYGNAFQLQVDVSRLPRLDQYNYMLSHDPTKMADIPSDVKTVAYYLAPPSLAEEDQLQSMDSGDGAEEMEMFIGMGRGLMRRELDRAVSTFAVTNGNYSRLENSGVLLAPEVNGIQFRYFDGTDWYDEWDSLEMDALPLAVEVTLFLDTGTEAAENGMVNPITNQVTDSDSYFRMIVAIPTAEFVGEEEVDPEDEALGL